MRSSLLGRMDAENTTRRTTKRMQREATRREVLEEAGWKVLSFGACVKEQHHCGFRIGEEKKIAFAVRCHRFVYDTRK
jgi:hypothetical protein